MTQEELEKIINEEGSHQEFEKHGLKCVLSRNQYGAWCGYVGVGKEHKLYGKDYYSEAVNNENIDVHGGLTFSGKAYWSNAEDGLWYFGFDCSHYGDLSLGLFIGILDKDAVYRTKEYVSNECEKLAEQLIKILK